MTLQQSEENQEQRHNQPTTENYLGSGGVVILPDDNHNPSVPVAEPNITKNNDDKIVTNSVLRTLPAEDYATMTIVPISSSLLNGGLTTANDLNVNGPYSEFQSWDSGNLVYGYIYGISGLTLNNFLNSSSAYENSNIVDAEKSTNPKDFNMCWAAAGANVLSLTGWKTSDFRNEDQIFNQYRSAFQFGNNIGGYANVGLNWYLTGNYSAPYGDQPKPGTGGFFNSSVNAANVSSFLSQKLFSSPDSLIDMCSNIRAGKGIVINIYNSAIAHSLTFMGYIAEAGYPIAIVVADSDDDWRYPDSTNSPNKIKLIKIIGHTYNSAGVMNGLALENIYGGGENFLSLGDYAILSAASFTTLSAGQALVSSGATIAQQTLGGQTTLNVSSAGLALETTINFGGTMNVGNGGKSWSTVIHSGGSATIKAGAVGAYTSVENGASLVVQSNGTARATILGSGLTQTVGAGQKYIGTTVAKGAIMVINATGSASYVNVSSGGTVKLAANARLSGLNIIGGTMSVNGAVVATGATVALAPNRYRSSSSNLVSNLKNLSGATVAIALNPTQTLGSYTLAADPGSFSQPLQLLSNRGVYRGTVSANGTFTENGIFYQVSSSSNALTLTAKAMYCSDTTGVIKYSLSANGTGLQKYYNNAITTLARPVGAAADWQLIGAGTTNTQTNQLFWCNNNDLSIYVQNDPTNSVLTYIGSLTDGYSVAGIGKFGSNNNQLLLTSSEYGDPSISTNIGLAVWNFNGSTLSTEWLGALVSTWQPGDALRGTTAAEINSLNYRYELLGVSDLNNDGRSEVIIRNAMPTTVDGVEISGAGDVYIFSDQRIVNGIHTIDISYIGNFRENWKYEGAGDFNNDGIDDILLSNGTDTLYAWLLKENNSDKIEILDSIALGSAAGGEVASIVKWPENSTPGASLKDAIVLCTATETKLLAWNDDTWGYVNLA